MSDSPLPTSLPEQVVRFRLRTLLTVTTVIAILAAIAGPYYRSVDSAGQRRLLIFWSAILLCSALSFWWRLRESIGKGAKLHVRFVVYAATDSWSVRERPSRLALGVIGVTVWTLLSSHVMGSGGESRGVIFSPCMLDS